MRKVLTRLNSETQYEYRYTWASVAVSPVNNSVGRASQMPLRTGVTSGSVFPVVIGLVGCQGGNTPPEEKDPEI